MQQVRVYPGLTRRLLVAAARAHYRGESPADWQDLAADTGLSPSSGAVNRALSHLANDGYIEGVYTPLGWLSVRPTARGLSRAGRAAHQLSPARREAALVAAAGARPDVIDLPPSDATIKDPAAHPRIRAAGAALHTLDIYLDERRRRLMATLSPRMLSFRAQVAHAWHLLTTFP